MTRKIVRTLSQIAVAGVITVFLLVFLDRTFDVLPNAIHEYMPQHHVGQVITDISVTTCNTMNPFTSCRLDPELWTRVEKDLFLGRTLLSSAYLHVRRKKEEELAPEDSVILDVRVGRLNPADSSIPNPEEEWHQRPNGIWIKTSTRRHASDSSKAVTNVDVLFGDDAVEIREGWSLVGTALLMDASIPAHLTVRRGDHKEPPKPKPRVRSNEKFKILQVSDLHLSTGVGACRDAVPDGYNGGKCMADPRTLDFVARVLDDEKPDLVVLSGDQVNGDTAPDPQTAIFKYAHLMVERKIPYVSIFGNHDDEMAPGQAGGAAAGNGLASRAAQMRLIESLPYSLSEAGPAELPGVGNYYLEVLAPGKSTHSAITIYFFDSHSYSPEEKKYPGYDWVKRPQVEWFKDTAEGLKEKHKLYTYHHINAAFVHIPLPEYRVAEQVRKGTGTWREGVTAPNYNSGLRDELVEQKVGFVSCGHDHANDYCTLSTDNSTGDPHTSNPNLWMCYAGGSGFGGYGGYDGYIRRVRVFDFEMNIGRVKTWKRVEWGPEGDEINKRWDETVLVDMGAVVGPDDE